MKNLKNKKGFTLMEMLIVVAIIVILVAIAIPTFSSALTKAKVATDEANVRAWYAECMTDFLLNEEAFPAEDSTEWTAMGGKLEVGSIAINDDNELVFSATGYPDVKWALPTA